MGSWVPAFSAVSAFVATARPHAHSLVFAVTGTVFFFGLLGLLMVEGLALYARQTEKSRQTLGEKGSGFVASMHRDFQKPVARRRLRILWLIEAAIGLVALIAFVA